MLNWRRRDPPFPAKLRASLKGGFLSTSWGLAKIAIGTQILSLYNQNRVQNLKTKIRDEVLWDKIREIQANTMVKPSYCLRCSFLLLLQKK